jgi:hypothetical protein
MPRKKEILRTAVMAIVMSLLATPAFARSIEFKGAGTALWIFLIIGAAVILLQLVPAAILFFSFVGSASSAVFGKERRAREEAILPETEPAPVKQ